MIQELHGVQIGTPDSCNDSRSAQRPRRDGIKMGQRKVIALCRWRWMAFLRKGHGSQVMIQRRKGSRWSWIVNVRVGRGLTREENRGTIGCRGLGFRPLAGQDPCVSLHIWCPWPPRLSTAYTKTHFGLRATPPEETDTAYTTAEKISITDQARI